MDNATNPANRVLPYAAGVSLIAGAAFFFAGLATSPPSTGDDKGAYLQSLAADPFQTQLSALLLHYGNLLMGVGLLALPLLVRGRRGSVVTLVGALLGALCLIEMSGALLSDWFHMEIGRNLPVEQAVALSDKVLAHPAQQLAFSPGPLVSPRAAADVRRAGAGRGHRLVVAGRDRARLRRAAVHALRHADPPGRWAPCRCSR